MKTVSRFLLVLALFGASMLGGFLANTIGSGLGQAAAQAAFGPPVKLTLLDVPNVSTTPDIFTSSPVKIADIGTFTVENDSSLVEVTHYGRVLVEAMTGNGVLFELRVDDALGVGLTDTQPSGLALVRSIEAGQYVPANFSGYWQDLPAGNHTVSIWVRASSSGMGDNALLDPGGWPSNIVVIKEFLPFGTTALPLINR